MKRILPGWFGRNYVARIWKRHPARPRASTAGRVAKAVPFMEVHCGGGDESRARSGNGYQ
jgi:hypothetical protein